MLHWDKNRVLNSIASKREGNSISMSLIATKLGLKWKDWKSSVKHSSFACAAVE